LTLEESLALAALAEQIGGHEQVPFTQAAAKAISKIRGQLPAALRQELEQIEQHVAIKLAAAQPPEAAKDVYQTVQRALASRRALRCEYESLAKDQNGQEFVFQPYTLFFSQRAWYVIGHHSLYDEVRCLKLNRFTVIQPTAIGYDIPKSFSLAEHLGHAWRMIRGKKRYEVELQFDAEFAETIADTHWHATQEVIWNEDESITFRCTVDGLDEIVWWVLSMGPHCVVMKPRELAIRVKELAEGIVGRYAKQPSQREAMTGSGQRRAR
jgi:predicted DNA-binding transcriptional regulator YafY